MKKYSIIKKIGEGGMGKVYLAHDNQLKRDVAIKKLIIDPDQDIDDQQKKEIISRFRQEAQAAARLNHPNIITIYQVGRSKTGDFIVMELLHGKPLSEWIKSGHAFSIEEVINIGTQICNALDYAHQSGVVHRDIKPDNIFLSENLSVKISDFGVARIETGVLIKTRAGVFLGTPAYSAPEQWQSNGKVDGRTDIYSLGVLLYRLLTGSLPHSAANINDLIFAILHNPAVSLRRHHPAVPENVEQAIMTAIEKLPEKRHQKGRDFASALVLPDPEKEKSENQAAEPTEGLAAPISQGPDMALLTEPHTLIEKTLNFSGSDWIPALFSHWDKKDLGGDRLNHVLDRLLDIPIYTDPFSGALLMDDSFMLLIWKGIILQAVNLNTRETGEKAFQAVTNNGKRFSLYKPGDEKSTDIPLVLSTLINQERILHKDVDSSIIDIAGLIRKLISEKFTGTTRFRYPKGDIYIGFCAGSRLFILQSRELDLELSSTVISDLTQIVQVMPFKLDVYETFLNPMRESIRRLFPNVNIEVKILPGSELTHMEMVKSKEKDYHPQSIEKLKDSVRVEIQPGEYREVRLGGKDISGDQLLYTDFNYRFLEWLFFDFFVSLISSGNKETMKYVTTWIPEIRKIRLNTYLEDDSGQNHLFDMVTMDKDNKILHLVHRGIDGETESLARFLDTVKSVKTRLIKTGDIGGVFYVSPENFSDASMSLFHEQTAGKKKQFGLGYIDSLTGFKGFVRIGKNRGFHLNLVTETSTGGFRLIGPVL